MSIVNGVKVKRRDLRETLKIGFGVLMDLFFSKMIFDSENKSNKILAAILLVLFTLFIVSGAKGRKKLRRIYSIGSLVSSVQTSEIKLCDLADAIGMKEKKLCKLLKMSFKKKLIHNCSLSEEGEATLILEVSVQAEKFTLRCPSCGAEFSAESGNTARCPECASVINL